MIGSHLAALALGVAYVFVIGLLCGIVVGVGLICWMDPDSWEMGPQP